MTYKKAIEMLKNANVDTSKVCEKTSWSNSENSKSHFWLLKDVDKNFVALVTHEGVECY